MGNENVFLLIGCSFRVERTTDIYDTAYSASEPKVTKSPEDGPHTEVGKLLRVISSNSFGFLYLLEDCHFPRFGNLDPQMATLILLTVGGCVGDGGYHIAPIPSRCVTTAENRTARKLSIGRYSVVV